MLCVRSKGDYITRPPQSVFYRKRQVLSIDFSFQDEVAQKAAKSLTGLYGTKYKVGPICSVICKYLIC